MKLFEYDKKMDKNQPIFLGQGKNVQRYDEPKYKFFWDIGERMDSLFWKPNEISLTQDKIDYVNSDEFFEYNNHKLPLITIDSNYGNFKAIVDDEGDILPLLYIGNKVDIVGEVHIDNQTNVNDLNDNSLIVDLVDLGF